MQQRSTKRSVPAIALTAAILIVFAGAFALAWFWPTSDPRGGGGDRPTPPTAPDGPGAEPITPPGAPPQRSEAPNGPSAPDAPGPLHPFAWYIERLCALGERTSELAGQDEVDAAKANDRIAREVLVELITVYPDTAERSLAMLAEQPEASTDRRDASRRVVLQVVLGNECRRRYEAAGANDRRGIDPLVQGVLDVMPTNQTAGEVGGALLADQPYLRAVHEAGVLGLVQLAGDGAFARSIATRLLLTLWDNMQRFGERSSAEMSRLALLLLGDSDASQRLAACRQLLLDRRFRAVLLAWLHDQKDPQLAEQLASQLADTAANELPAFEALDVLRDLTPLLQRSPGSYVGLGARAPDVVADAYREHLAADTQPDVRRQLVFAIGMVPNPFAIEIAELALANDPSPDVRVQAMFALTAGADPERAERAMMQLLDDPAITGDRLRVASLIAALRNLERGDPNAVDRAGRRLAALTLADADRQELERTLARSLPGGLPPGGLPAGGLPPREVARLPR